MITTAGLISKRLHIYKIITNTKDGGYPKEYNELPKYHRPSLAKSKTKPVRQLHMYAKHYIIAEYETLRKFVKKNYIKSKSI